MNSLFTWQWLNSSVFILRQCGQGSGVNRSVWKMEKSSWCPCKPHGCTWSSSIFLHCEQYFGDGPVIKVYCSCHFIGVDCNQPEALNSSHTVWMCLAGRKEGIYYVNSSSVYSLSLGFRCRFILAFITYHTRLLKLRSIHDESWLLLFIHNLCTHSLRTKLSRHRGRYVGRWLKICKAHLLFSDFLSEMLNLHVSSRSCAVVCSGSFAKEKYHLHDKADLPMT